MHIIEVMCHYYHGMVRMHAMPGQDSLVPDIDGISIYLRRMAHHRPMFSNVISDADT